MLTAKASVCASPPAGQVAAGNTRFSVCGSPLTSSWEEGVGVPRPSPPAADAPGHSHPSAVPLAQPPSPAHPGRPCPFPTPAHPVCLGPTTPPLPLPPLLPP